MKKIVSLVLVMAICMVSLCSCSVFSRVRVNGTGIDNEVYKYFDDLCDGDDESVKKAISRYVTINSEFTNRSLTLSSSQKSNLSLKVDDLWHLYGLHYDDIGVSKQTLYKIETSKMYEDALLDYYYSQGGVSPVKEEQIKKFFKENYIAVRFATGYLFNIDEQGTSVSMTDSERAVIINGFANSVDLINTGSPMESATDYEVRDAIISTTNDGGFPAGFYDEVKVVDIGSATTITLYDYAFLVERIDPFDKTYNYYATYRTECLRKMKGTEFEKMVNEWSQKYKVD